MTRIERRSAGFAAHAACVVRGRRCLSLAAALAGWLLALCLGVAGAQSLPTPLDEASGVPAVGVDWHSMTAAARADLRMRYRAWRELSEAERARLRQAEARFAALPVDQQRALRARFEAMDRLHRDGWRLGPSIGAHYPQLQPLFGYVPPAQRDGLIRLLQGLDAKQLQQLATLSQRTPPQDRDALRNQLLAQPPGGRGAWLQAKLGH